MIQIYAGYLKEDKTVDVFYPVTIAAANSLYYLDRPSEYPVYTKAMAEYNRLDSIPTNLHDIYNEEFVTRQGLETEDIRGVKMLSFFTEEDANTVIENFGMLQLNYGAYFIGDIVRGIGFSCGQMGIDKMFLIIPSMYKEATSFQSLINALENHVITEPYNFPCFVEWAPFYIYGQENGNYVTYTNGTWFAGVESMTPGLSSFHNWRIMLLNEATVAPVVIGLKEPITLQFEKTIDRIELSAAAVTSETFDIFEENDAPEGSLYEHFYALSHFQLGTDLSCIYPGGEYGYNPTETPIELNDDISLEYSGGDGGFVYTLNMGDKKLVTRAKNLLDDSFIYSKIIDARGPGLYLLITPGYEDKELELWEDELDNFEPHTLAQPFVMASVFLPKYNRNDYYVNDWDYDEYPDFLVPAMVVNLYRTEEEDTTSDMDINAWKTVLQYLSISEPKPIENNPNPGIGSIGGGYVLGNKGGAGNYDDTSDRVTDSLPMSLLGSSLIRVFNLGGATAEGLAEITAERLGKLRDFLNDRNLLSAFEDRTQGIVSLKMLMLPESLTGVTQQVYVRGVDLDFQATNMPAVVYEISLGDFNVKEYYGNFLDYDKTSIKIYLPYSGVHELNPSLIVGAHCTLKVRVDILTGDLIYTITSDKDTYNGICYTFNGNCSLDMPLTSTDYSAKVSSMINTTMSIGNAIGQYATGQYLGMAMSLGNAAINGIAAAKKPGDIATTGAIGREIGSMAVAYPYLIIERPKCAIPETYGKTFGYPSNISETLGRLKGYTEIDEIHLEGVGLTKSELDELEAILKSGFVIN